MNVGVKMGRDKEWRKRWGRQRVGNEGQEKCESMEGRQRLGGGK